MIKISIAFNLFINRAQFFDQGRFQKIKRLLKDQNKGYSLELFISFIGPIFKDFRRELFLNFRRRLSIKNPLKHTHLHPL